MNVANTAGVPESQLCAEWSYFVGAPHLPRGSMISRRSLRNTPEFHDPVSIPSLARVFRACLLPTRRCRRNLRPRKTRPNGFAIHWAVRIKSTHAMLESPLNWRVESKVRIAAVDPPDCPFFGFEVERADRGTVGNAGRPGKHVFFDIALPCHERLSCACSVEFLPRAVARTFRS